MATMREVERMIQAVRECDNMIRYITEHDSTTSMAVFLRGSTQGARDAMVGGLIQRKNNFIEALSKLGIIDHVSNN